MKSLLLSCFCLFSISSFSQIIVYPKNSSKEKARNVRYYNILGQTNDNILVFIATKFENDLSVYDHSMRLIKRNEISFLPKKISSVIFFPYPKFTWAIYVYQKKTTVYCMAAKMNEEGELINSPIGLDSTHVNSFDNKAIYGFVRSEDKSKILIFKQENSSKGILFSTMLYNNEMQLLNRKEQLVLNSQNEFFNNFSVNNDGDWIFTGAFSRGGYTRANITGAQLFIQKNKEDSFKIESLPLAGKLLDELMLKIDNKNHRVLINSFYSSNTNIEGLFSAAWNEENKKWETVKISELGAPIRTLANETSDHVSALNDFYINKIILKKDGGFLVIAEERQETYSSKQPVNPDRSISFSLYDTYYYNARDFWVGIPKQMNTYQSGMNYNNILILSTNENGELQWGNVVAKKQRNGPGWSSFATILRGDNLDFFYNDAFRKTWLLENKSVTSDGKVINNPLIRGLQDNYIFIPSRGKQVGEDEFIIPYLHDNILSFAKIDF